MTEKGKRSHHGGVVYELVDDPLDARSFVCADVLDAWFDPSPAVLSTLREDIGWMTKSAPPACPESLARSIATWRRASRDTIVLGAGSSDLIHRFFTRFLKSSSNVFVLDPTYAEYRHVCEQVVGCRVSSFPDFSSVDESFDLVVVVNPNNPTGELFSRSELVRVLDRLRRDAVLWIDEAYMPFVDGGESMHGFDDRRVVVCQSLSKCLALSGLRVAFLSACPDVADTLRSLTPPWNISLPATLAVDAAISDLEYYADKYAETRLLRRELASALAALDVGTVHEGAANWVTLQSNIAASELIESCRSDKVLLRDGKGMFEQVPMNFVRIAVKGREELTRIVSAVNDATVLF